MPTDAPATAAALLPLVGGAANVRSVTHCMTRLRLRLADPALVDDDGVRGVPGVLGVVMDGESYQIVLGPGVVAKVAAHFPAPGAAAARPPGAGPGRQPAAGPPAGPDREPGARLPAGPDTGAATGPGVGSATGPGPRPDPDTGSSSGPDTGPATGPGSGAGTDPSSGPGTDPGTDPASGRAAYADRLARDGARLRERQRRRNATPLKAALRRIADVFVPLIPALVGCGVLAGLNGLLVNARLLPWLTPALAAIASAFMALIAVFVGYLAAQEFGGTPVLGAAVAAVVVFPGVAKVTVFGTALAPGQGGVLGALAAALLGVRVERWCRRWVPETLDVLLTPALTVLVTGLATLYGLMWAAGAVSNAIGTAAGWLLATTGPVAGFLLGGLFLPLVMLGLHQALIPIHTTLIEQQGYTVLLPVLAMAGAGQVGAAAAVYVRLRHDRSVRTTIRSALPAGLLGVGEPLIYGVSLPLGRPFLTACVGGAAGGAFLGVFAMLGDRVGATAIGPSGLALFPLLAGSGGAVLTSAIYGGGLLTAYTVGFLATYALFRPAPDDAP
ncbi:PTS transporter subunit EIIC [Streptomyces mangrovisoli]|uniref:PTS alpha-glucoside transporter subunit IIA n=1 Tax=Streptomyces mangrovisoli TaxID=1428628 RepID=A0A1J4P569_9ACTN|nr:PTS transporter subunit EIIC [Streptomyces mangrovisoli]OIJ69929.1 PTS alpha-glucoside transporter subunit IIA [Streptomyces mangrovisoli]